MASTRQPRKAAPAEDSIPQVPQSTPTSYGYGPPHHDFTLQTIMELQKSVGAITSKLDSIDSSMGGVKGSVDSVKTKVDDLVALKNKVIGGAIALGAVAGIVGFIVGKASDYVTIKQPVASAQAPSAPASK